MASPLTLSIRRSLFQSPIFTTHLPPAFLLPLRARISTITNTTSPEPQPQSYHPTNSPPPPSKLHKVPLSQRPEPTFTPNNAPSATSTSASHTPTQSLLATHLQPASPSPSKPGKIPALLPLLAAQPPHYITAHIHARPYLLTAGDTLRLPFLMPNAPLGSILRLNRASMLGSRDYTLRGDEGERGGRGYIDERFFVCRARVVGVETEPLRVVEKTKRRNRKVKRVKSKMRFTVLRVLEVGVRVPGERDGEEDAEVEARHVEA
ncbi:MAG: hypothetical protein Q9221_005893 [Calogaya cf. arnoldii]